MPRKTRVLQLYSTSVQNGPYLIFHALCHILCYVLICFDLFDFLRIMFDNFDDFVKQYFKLTRKTEEVFSRDTCRTKTQPAEGTKSRLCSQFARSPANCK